MIIDISAYNGHIDWQKVKEQNYIERVILRATTKNGEPDALFSENFKAILKVYDNKMPIDVYKFSYAFNYSDAAAEAYKLIATLKQLNVLHHINRLWLDLEPANNEIHTASECDQVISAYASICDIYEVPFGIYCNYSYLKSNMRHWTKIFPFWLARWNDTMGDTEGFDIRMWQYSDKGSVAGINGAVDLSRYV